MMTASQLKIKTYWIWTFIIGVLYLMPVNFIGTMRFGEILFMVVVLLFPFRVWNQFRKFSENKVFFVLLLLSLVITVISSTANDSSSIGILKGGANILFTLSSFLGVFYLFRGHRERLIGFFLGLLISDYLFGYFILTEGTYEIVSEQETRNSQFFDLFVVPKLIPLIIALGLIWKNSHIRMILIGLIIGLTGLLLNARSFGLVLIVSCAVCLMAQMNIAFLKRYLVLLVPVLFYLVYTGYRDAAYRGQLGDQSKAEIKESELLGRNALSTLLLSIGRPDPLVAMLAIEEKPIWGHGSYNPKGIRYVQMADALNILSDSRINQFMARDEVSIPSHSVLLQSIVEGGIMAGLVWIYVIIVVVKMIYKHVSQRLTISSYQFLIIYLSIISLWGILLSPYGFARFDLPVYWAIIISHGALLK